MHPARVAKESHTAAARIALSTPRYLRNTLAHSTPGPLAASSPSGTLVATASLAPLAIAAAASRALSRPCRRIGDLAAPSKVPARVSWSDGLGSRRIGSRGIEIARARSCPPPAPGANRTAVPAIEHGTASTCGHGCGLICENWRSCASPYWNGCLPSPAMPHPSALDDR
jgi:hypothetical protein